MSLKNRERAIVWMRENLNVVKMFEDFAQQLVDRNRCFGINLIRERVRWECHYEHGQDYKFPNDFSPYVARVLLERHPEWVGNLTCKSTQDEKGGEIRLIYPSELGLQEPSLV